MTEVKPATDSVLIEARNVRVEEWPCDCPTFEEEGAHLYLCPVILIPALLARIEAAEDRANHTKVEAKMAEWDREAAHADLVVASHRMTDALLLKPALRLIQADPHLWSKRPCQTCDAVSAIAGEPFGCVKKRMEAVNG